MADGDAVLVPFLAAFQASLSILLTILVGVVGVQFGLISECASKEVSRLCTKLFLPMLLITNVGSQLHSESVLLYVPIIIWAILTNIVSLVIGVTMTKLFNMPHWVTPAIAFNNTNSLPLLLIQALSTTGILDTIDSSSSAVARAKSYFLINATVRNCLTFTIGPKLLNPDEDDLHGAPEKTDQEFDAEIEQQERSAEESNEQTSLLPKNLARAEARIYYSAYLHGSHLYRSSPPWLKSVLFVLFQFINAPVIGATVGAIIGLVPALHRLFFNDQQDGGYFNAWLTNALSNVGNLFVALQVVIIGVKLSVAVLRFRHGESSGNVTWAAFSVIVVMRFFVWPAISISVIWALASRTELLGDDRILWFAMMLMPTGPSALNLTALADMGDTSEDEKLGIAKVLTAEYVISPLICLAVVGSLKACQSIDGS